MPGPSPTGTIITQDFHGNLIKFMNNFHKLENPQSFKHVGYQMDEAGLCFGWACMALQAEVYGEKRHEEFRVRTAALIGAFESSSMIKSQSEIVKQKTERIKKIFNLLNKPSNPTDTELAILNTPEIKNEILELHAFFDGVAMYFKPEKFQNLLQEPDSGLISDQISGRHLVENIITPTPQDINAEPENIHEIYSKADHYGRVEDITKYLNELAEGFEKINKKIPKLNFAPHGTVGCLLSNHGHVIKIGYNLETKQWNVADANQFSGSIKDLTGSAAAAIILNGLSKQKPTKTKATFSTRVFHAATNQDTQEIHKLLVEHLPKDRNLQGIAPDDRNNLLTLAESVLDVQVIVKSTPDDAKIDKVRSAIGKNQLEIMEIFLQNGFDPEKNINIATAPTTQTALGMAISLKKTEMVEMLLSKGATTHKVRHVNDPSRDLSAQDLAQLELTRCLVGSPEYAELTKIIASINKSRDTDAVTPEGLSSGRRLYSVELAFDELLNTPPAATTAMRVPRVSAKLLAAQQADAMLGGMLEREAQAEAPKKQTQDEFFDAVESGNISEIRRCLDGGADVNAKNTDGDTALHLAILADDVSVPIVKALMLAGADLNVQNNKGETAIHMAAFIGELEALKTMLLDNMYDMSIQDNNNDTVLNVAVVSDNAEIITLLAGAELRLAAEENNIEKINEILKLANGNKEIINSKDKDGETALFIAAKYGYIDTVKLLLTKGSDTESKTIESGRTALQIAAMSNHIDVVNALLNKPAKIDAVDAEGNSALQLACNAGNVDVVRALLDKNANVKTVDLTLGTIENNEIINLIASKQSGTELVLRGKLRATKPTETPVAAAPVKSARHLAIPLRSAPPAAVLAPGGLRRKKP